VSVDRWTVFARWPDGTVEEVDVDANDSTHACALAAAELADGHDPGWTIVRVVGPRVGWYT